MKFFIDKKRAHRNTLVFAVLFVLNVLIISTINALFVSFFLSIEFENRFEFQRVFAICFLLTISLFLLTTYHSVKKMIHGVFVADLLGGRILNFPLQNEIEKRLYNVIEEMAIASGTTIPFVFIQDHEDSINAFAAGESPNNHVICLTAGAVNSLTRDELQAVVAHEYSHILNEDTTLNAKLAGGINGFMFFMKMGEHLLDRRRRRRHIKGNSKNTLLGLFFYCLGSVGYFIARYMQSLISQQREYLADSNSAQFTRNPESLARALAKIHKGHGSFIKNPDQLELAHIFFAESTTGFFSKFFKTHPPIEDRIKKLIPNNTKVEDFISEVASSLDHKKNAERLITQIHKEKMNQMVHENTEDFESLGAQAKGAVAASLLLGQSLLLEVPDSTKASIQVPETAKIHLFSVICSTSKNESELLKTLSSLHSEYLPAIEADLALIRSNHSQRKVLFQLAMGTLQTLPEQERKQIWQQMFHFFSSDQDLSLIECLYLYLAKDILVLQRRKRPLMNLKPNVQQAYSLGNLMNWMNLRSQDSEIINAVEQLTEIRLPKVLKSDRTWPLFENQLDLLIRMPNAHRLKISQWTRTQTDQNSEVVDLFNLSLGFGTNLSTQ